MWFHYEGLTHTVVQEFANRWKHLHKSHRGPNQTLSNSQANVVIFIGARILSNVFQNIFYSSVFKKERQWENRCQFLFRMCFTVFPPCMLKERFALVTLYKRATVSESLPSLFIKEWLWAIRSGRSLKKSDGRDVLFSKSESLFCSFDHTKTNDSLEKTDERIPNPAIIVKYKKILESILGQLQAQESHWKWRNLPFPLRGYMHIAQGRQGPIL